MAFNATLNSLTRPEQVGPLIIEPVTRESIALATTTVVRTDSNEYRIPKITADPSADWIAPNTEIPASEATGDEVIVRPTTLAGISYLANQLVHDTDPAAHGIVGQRLAADLARKIDAAFFGPHIVDDQDPGYNAQRPAGLESVPLANLSRITANPATGIDPWTDAYYAAEAEGVHIDSWVTTPEIALALAKVKSGTGSNSPLLSFVDGQRTIHGAPVHVSPFVTAGSVWGIPKDRTFSVVLEDVRVDFDTSVRFAFNQTAVRTTMRVGFGLAHTKGLVLIRA